MGRTFARSLLVWIGLFGLIPAALACAQTMVNRDCCPPGQHMPCDDEQSSGTVEAAACCATPNLAPSAVSVASAQEDLYLPVLVPVVAAVLPAPRVVVRACSVQPTGPPDLRFDRSPIYLTTARLRL